MSFEVAYKNEHVSQLKLARKFVFFAPCFFIATHWHGSDPYQWFTELHCVAKMGKKMEVVPFLLLFVLLFP